MAFASRFLELIGVVWVIEYFKYYLFGKKLTVLTDHRALFSLLKSHRSNKSYNSRLTRWIDCLIPFDFNKEHIPATRMGPVDYNSRQPNQKAKCITQYDEEFMVATISHIRNAITTSLSHSNKIPFQKRHNTRKRQIQDVLQKSYKSKQDARPLLQNC